MTDEVAVLVLRDNVLQNLALSMTEQLGQEVLEAQTRLMRRLQAEGRLDRKVEQLPSDAELVERRKHGKGLTRPECAVLLAYAKMTLYEDLLRTEIPDRAHLAIDVAKYFPRPLRRRFTTEIAQHRLKREIIATWIANSVVNRGLAVFVSELEDETGNSLEDIMTAYVVARDSFGLLGVWGAIEALPASVPGDVQTRLLVTVRGLLLRGTRWFMAQVGRPLRIGETVERFRPRIETVMRQLDDVLGPGQVAAMAAAQAEYEQAGVEPALARTMAGLQQVLAACDIVCVAPLDDEAALLRAARSYFALENALDLPWLKARIQAAPRQGRWERLALTGLEEDLAGVLRRLTAAAMRAGIGEDNPAATQQRVEAWLDGTLLAGLRRYRALVGELHQAADADLPMLTVAVRTLGELVPRGGDA